MFLKQVHKGGIEFYQFLLTIILVIGGYILGQIPLSLVAVYYVNKQDDSASMDEFLSSMNFSEIGMSQNLTLFLLLLMFVVAMTGLYFGVTRLHKRSFLSVFTSRSSLDFKRVFFGFGLWMVLTFILEIVGYIASPENYIWQFELMPFLGLLVIVAVMLPIQTTFEEVFIRGYLMQSLSLLSNSRLMPLIVSSMIFGAMHLMNPEVQEYGMGVMMSYYIGIAIFLGALTLLDDGLELAIGIHAATNIYGALFATFDDSAIRTPALFKLAEVDPSDMAIYSLLAAALFFSIVVKKFGLTSWWKIFGATKALDRGQLAVLHQEKSKLWSKAGLTINELSPNIEDESSFCLVKDSAERQYLVSMGLSPFSLGGEIQQKCQLGYYEVAIPRGERLQSDELERWTKMMPVEVYRRSLLINKAYKFEDPDGELYAVMARFPGGETMMIDAWPTCPVLLLPITKEEYELSETQGAAVVIHKFQEQPNYPFEY